MISGRFIFASTLILTGYLMVDVGDMLYYISSVSCKKTNITNVPAFVVHHSPFFFLYVCVCWLQKVRSQKRDSLANRRCEIEIYPPFVNFSISRFCFLLTTPHKHANSYLFSGIKIWYIFSRMSRIIRWR